MKIWCTGWKKLWILITKKMRPTVLFFAVFLFLFSCSTDDDICGGGEGTPRMKIKFKTYTTGKPKTMDSLFVSVDYGNGIVPVIERRTATDSVFVPLRVDDHGFTDLYISTSQQGIKSQIRVKYNDKTEYVSPACGIRKLYENVSSEIITVGPVPGIENAQNEIINENKTHLFLLF